MGVGAGLYMCDLVKKFTFAISSPDEFLLTIPHIIWAYCYVIPTLIVQLQFIYAEGRHSYIINHVTIHLRPPNRVISLFCRN